MFTLRPYQTAAIANLRDAYRRGRKSPVLCLSTGGGKTVVFGFVAASASERGSRVLVLVHRRELLNQAARSLGSMGIELGLIAPGHSFFKDKSVQVASVQTLVRRLASMDGWAPDLIIIDEGHHACAGSWAKIVEHWPNARCLGVTATPCRMDDKGLGNIYDEIVYGPSMNDLIEAGYLSKYRVYAPPMMADLKGIKKRGGDFARDQVASAMDKPTITGDAVKHYRRICDGVPAIAFCASIEHAKHVAENFKASGYQARSVDGCMGEAERSDAIGALGDGRIHVLTSCDIISEGTDIPVVTAAILLRPTSSTGLYMQQVGRVLRPSPGKEYAYILDHVGNVMRHGMPSDDREWSLEAGAVKPRKTDGDEVKVKQCPKCYAAHTPQPVCPMCGYVYENQGRKIEEVEGELEEIKAAAVIQKKREVGLAKSLADLERIASERGYKRGWAQHIWAARQARGA